MSADIHDWLTPRLNCWTEAQRDTNKFGETGEPRHGIARIAVTVWTPARSQVDADKLLYALRPLMGRAVRQSWPAYMRVVGQRRLGARQSDPVSLVFGDWHASVHGWRADAPLDHPPYMQVEARMEWALTPQAAVGQWGGACDAPSLDGEPVASALADAVGPVVLSLEPTATTLFTDVIEYAAGLSGQSYAIRDLSDEPVPDHKPEGVPYEREDTD